jgi:hypothetical protein
MNNTQRVEAVGKADAVADLLSHIGWVDVLKPALERERATLATQLVAQVLGRPDDKGPTKEQLAGLIYGIDRMIKVVEGVLSRGTDALEALEAQGFHLNSANS